MLSLNFLLVCNAILNLPPYKFVFPISMSSEFFNARPFFSKFFCYCILCSSPLPRQQFYILVLPYSPCLSSTVPDTKDPPSSEVHHHLPY